MQFNVTATNHEIVRTEKIDTDKNELFFGMTTPEEVKKKYEDFWSNEGIEVIKVEED